MFRILLIFTFLFPSTLNALVFDGKFIQGHFIIGKTQPETEIWIDKKRLKYQKTDFLLSELVEIENTILSLPQ